MPGDVSDWLEQLDPEDLREVNRAYQDACKAAIERYEGYVARYMGDGVLAYFGFPQAHEEGEAGQAISSLTNALQLVERTGERVWEAGIRTLFGKVLLSPDLNNIQEAETMFIQALDIASEQGAKSLELRAAIGLAGIWQKRGRQDEAQKILAPIYERFNEGFDTPDLIEAKALLEL